MDIDFSKDSNLLVPAIIQDANTQKVLMLGYMNEEALRITRESKKVTFFSRSKNRLWTKGEESGNFLNLVSITPDCDSDALLVKVNPVGPTCHTGADTCWNESNQVDISFIAHLQEFITKRYNEMPEGSYTTKLFKDGVNRMAQKVGEEAVETVIDAINGNDEGFLYEASDLVYHLVVLLTSKGYSLNDIAKELEKRHK